MRTQKCFTFKWIKLENQEKKPWTTLPDLMTSHHSPSLLYLPTSTHWPLAVWRSLKSRKYALLHTFSLNTSRSPKLIPKADLQRECPYFYSNFFFEEFWSIFKKKVLKKNYFPLYFKNGFGRCRGLFYI